MQEDGAPGHGYANRTKNGVHQPTEFHQQLTKEAKKRNIFIFKQPANSPDMNVNDLGFFHSLDSRFIQSAESLTNWTKVELFKNGMENLLKKLFF